MKALIVEDENFAREYLSSILLNDCGFKEVVQADDGQAGWERYQEGEFQVIVLDLILPKLDGLKLAERMLDCGRGQRILALSSECDQFTVREVARSGILGFIHKKEMSGGMLVAALNELLDGHVFYSENVKQELIQMQRDSDAYYRILSKREQQVLRLIAQQKTDEEIGEELSLSKFTVRRHRHNSMQKLNLKNESAIIHFALEIGILKHRDGLDWSE